MQGVLITVPLTSVDWLCNSSAVDLVKIDAEGLEDKVLKDMMENLASTSPTNIYWCNPDGPSQVIESFLIGFGYRLYHPLDERLVPVKSIEADQHGNFRIVQSTASPVGSQAK